MCIIYRSVIFSDTIFSIIEPYFFSICVYKMNDNLSLSLSHGEKFMHNQKKNKTNGRNEVGKEGFDQMSESTLTLKNDTEDLLERTHMTSVDKEALKNLKQEYAKTLTEYKTLQSKIHNKTNEYYLVLIN